MTALPDIQRAMRIDVVRPDGRIVATTWLRGVSRGQIVRITIARAVFARHPGRWQARFSVQHSVRSAIAFAVRTAA